MPKVSIELSDEEMEAIQFLRNLRKYTGKEVLRRQLSVYGMCSPYPQMPLPTTPTQCPSCGANLSTKHL